jgi:hypothetical protein
VLSERLRGEGVRGTRKTSDVLIPDFRKRTIRSLRAHLAGLFFVFHANSRSAKFVFEKMSIYFRLHNPILM